VADGTNMKLNTGNASVSVESPVDCGIPILGHIRSSHHQKMSNGRRQYKSVRILVGGHWCVAKRHSYSYIQNQKLSRLKEFWGVARFDIEYHVLVS
jgi:hypothetical protein